MLEIWCDSYPEKPLSGARVVAQHVKLPPVLLASLMCNDFNWLFYFQSTFFLMAWETRGKMAQALGSLLPTWETWIEL